MQTNQKNNKRNISLIGMMGCGKTTVAKELKNFLENYILVDIDKEIEKSQGFSIPVIFANFGESFFRKKEEETIKNILDNDFQIISTGGGIFENENNRNIILANSIVFYLKTSPEVIYERIKNETHRPLLGENFSADKISSIIEKRKNNYQKAHFVIDTDFKTPYNIVTEIMKCLNYM